MYSHNSDNNNNKCQKFHGKTFLQDFNKQLLLRKKAALHTTSLTQCKARHVLWNLLSTNQENDSEIIFPAETTKINLKKLNYQL